MSNYKLNYFDARALGETARLLFTAAGIEFEDRRWTWDNWPEIQKTSPTGVAPWLEVDGQFIPESFAINRFLANKFGFAGKDEFEKAFVDATADFYRFTMEDSRPYTWIARGIIEGDKDSVYHSQFHPAVEKAFNYIASLLEKSESDFVTSSGITWVDFYLVENMLTIFNIVPKLRDEFPAISNYEIKVHDHPLIKDYNHGHDNLEGDDERNNRHTVENGEYHEFSALESYFFFDFVIGIRPPAHNYKTAASITESDEESEEKDDFKPHEEDNELNRGLLPRPVGETQPIDELNSHPIGIDEDQGRPDESISFISRAFTTRKTFSCPKTKTDFVTGGNIATLNPEDVEVIAAMGDNVATGEGLWSPTMIEFRGASFAIGGDASIDGLVTVPNILREFTEHPLIGVSHGMGSRDELPFYQLNVAQGRSNTSNLPEQATELVRRLNNFTIKDIRGKWTMVIVTIGTEELCSYCGVPNVNAINEATDILNRGIHKGFVVVIGPLYITLASEQNKNLLRDKCPCLKPKSDNYIQRLLKEWENGLIEVQEHNLEVKRRTFGVLVLPFLTVTSRYPKSLFVRNTTLLNRRGHNYAAKWIWNRLVSGPKYNLSDAILSRDKYFCPSVGCPYFRNLENFKDCPILRHVDATEEDVQDMKKGVRPKRDKFTLYKLALIVVGLAFCTATSGCIIFYWMSKHQKHGRFDMEPIVEDGIYKEYKKPRGLTVSSKKGDVTPSSEDDEYEKRSYREPEYPYRKPENETPFYDKNLLGYNSEEEEQSFLNIGR
ncbi:hypothetical protein FO519_001529 [Halicephalobus sp. NKZ332]|nr:hypothetical protein FO519_001529 [Halicephalobus sp. NKZ332]